MYLPGVIVIVNAIFHHEQQLCLAEMADDRRHERHLGEYFRQWQLVQIRGRTPMNRKCIFNGGYAEPVMACMSLDISPSKNRILGLGVLAS